MSIWSIIGKKEGRRTTVKMVHGRAGKKGGVKSRWLSDLLLARSSLGPGDKVGGLREGGKYVFSILYSFIFFTKIIYALPPCKRMIQATSISTFNLIFDGIKDNI